MPSHPDDYQSPSSVMKLKAMYIDLAAIKTISAGVQYRFARVPGAHCSLIDLSLRFIDCEHI